jgi:hypothetical protein
MIRNIPTKEQVILSIPDVEKEYTVDFDDRSYQYYDETNEKHVQSLWGPVRLLTTDLAIRLPFDTPIIAVWGDFHGYTGHYGIKKELISTVSFSSLIKEHDMVTLTIDIIDGLYKDCKKITFQSLSDGKIEYLTYGSGALPVYIYL